MKLTCPYDWFCGKEFEISGAQEAFIQRAIVQGMSSMFLECTVCKVLFAYNPKTDETRPSHRRRPDLQELTGPKKSTR